MMTQFVILFVLLAPGGQKQKFWVYGKPTYTTGDLDLCMDAANKIVRPVMKRASRAKIVARATTRCHEVRADEA